MSRNKLTLAVVLTIGSLFLLILSFTSPAGAADNTGKTTKEVLPEKQAVKVFPPINVREAAQREAVSAKREQKELKSIEPPQPRPKLNKGVKIPKGLSTPNGPAALTPSTTGIAPAPSESFKAAESQVPVIPPDTMGAVGTTHIVTVTNDIMRIHNRNGVIVTTMSLDAFWSGFVLEGGATPSTFDPKIYFDRFNNRFIFVSSANAVSKSSAFLFAVSQTADPTGFWNLYAIDVDPTATEGSGGSGKWLDFPNIGFNKNWIVAMYNVYNYTCSTTSPFPCSTGGYAGPYIYVIDKAAAYANTLSSVSVFSANSNATCPTSATPELEFACGFSMTPAITEDNTTTTEYLLEDWDSTAAQLRLSTITGTVGSPVLTVATQFPQSANSWRFDATRIGTTGGYMPEKEQLAYAVSTTTRMMAVDSRLGASPVLRNGSLWAVHHIMLPTTPTVAGTQVGGGGPPDNHTGIQWWQIDPTIVNSVSGTAPIQRGRIEDASADNCFNGISGLVATPPCNGSAANQHGTFFAFPSISVNQNNDVLVGFTQFSPLTYPSCVYAFRAGSDPLNTMRDPVGFHPGQSQDNSGAGSGTTRQNRWGDYSAAQTDPLNDTNFWTTQEYTGVYRDIGSGTPVCPWETWWVKVSPSTPAPSTSGNLLISEFRLRGPQGVRDEFVELYNPSDSPLIVTTTDNSDGWGLAYSSNGTTVTGVGVIPNGTVIPGRGHLLFADAPNKSDPGGLPTTVYSLTSYPNTQLRTSESDIGWSVDLADNGGIAIFKTATIANFAAGTRMDSVGFSGIAAGLFREGTGIPNISATTPTGQMTFYRDLFSGPPQDTDANQNDFIFADPVFETLTLTPVLGAAGPENRDSAIHNTAANNLLSAPLDPARPDYEAPNFVYDGTSDPGNNSTFGTLTIRRTFTNNTGAPITRLRFRIVEITTSPTAPGAADLRARNSILQAVPIVGANAACPGNLCTVQATTLETPPTQANGGGFDSSLGIGVISFSAPLPNGSSVNVGFRLGIQAQGAYRFKVIAESLPGVSTFFDVDLPVAPLAAVSRKKHGTGGAGTSFNINMPFAATLASATSGVECRNGGDSDGGTLGDYKVVLTFNVPVTGGTASIAAGNHNPAGGGGSVGTVSFSGNDMIIPLTGVTNGQVLTVTASNVTDGTTTLSSVSVNIGFLIGDTTGDRSVNVADIGQTKSQSGQPVTVTNFREDVTRDGSVNVGDIGLVKSKSGTAVP